MDNEIHNKIFREIAPKYVDVTNLSSAGVLKGLLEILAESASLIREHQKNVAKEAYIQSASGAALDYLVGQVGIERREAAKTTGYVVFGRNGKLDKAIQIKKNTIVKTKLNSLGKEYRYFVVEDTVMQMNIDKTLVKVTAEETGAYYNVPENYITRLVNPVSGIDYVKNELNWIIEAGTDGETDESLGKRYFAKWGELITGANEKAYESWARSVNGVTDVVVVPIPRGYNTVDIIVSTANGTASEEIIEEIKSVIEQNKPIGVDAIVYSPIPVEIDIGIILHLLPSCLQNEVENIKQKTIEIINTMFVSTDEKIEIFKIGEDFVLDKMKLTIMNNIKGIKYIEFIEPTDNVEISNHQIATKGTINITTEMAEEI